VSFSDEQITQLKEMGEKHGLRWLPDLLARLEAAESALEGHTKACRDRYEGDCTCDFVQRVLAWREAAGKEPKNG
jgi:hypothetical protein